MNYIDLIEKLSEKVNDLEREINRLKIVESSSGAVTDHGALTGLSDDDHTQYAKDAGSSTTNAIVKFTGTDGRSLSNTGVTIDSSNHVYTPGHLAVGGVTASTSRAIQSRGSGTTGSSYSFFGQDSAGATTFVIRDDKSAQCFGNFKVSGTLADASGNLYGRPVFLTTPLTSTYWDGNAYSSNGGKTLIDLSAVFGVPAGVKAVLLECAVNDSSSLTYSTFGGAWIMFSGQNDDAWTGQGINLEKEPNDAHRNAHMTVACNANGDIYYRINASGTGTMDVILKVWGYWL